MALLLFDSLSPGRKKALVWIVSVWLFYTVVGFFIVPLVVRAVAMKHFSKQLDRPITIQKVRFNPYAFSATIRGVLVKDKDGEPLVSWNEAYANFQLASLFHRAWIFKEVRCSQPFVRVQMSKDYALTFSDIVNRLSKSGAPRPSGVGKTRALRIDRLRFIGARAAVADLTPRVPFRRTIGPFAMTLTHFSTDSDHRNSFEFSGITDAGERIAWQGFFCLDPLWSEGEFSFDGICLTNYAPLYQDAIRFEIDDGVINLHSVYRYQARAGTQRLLMTNTTIAAESLKVAEKATGQTVLDVSRCLVSGASVDATARRVEADAVAITDGRLVLHRNKDTSVNVIELAKPTEAAPNTPGGIIMLLRAMTNLMAVFLNSTNLSTGAIRNLSVTNCALHLEDLVNAQPVRLDLEGIAVNARNISNRTGSNMTAEVRMRWETNGAVRADIKASLAPPSAEVRMALDRLDLRPLAAYLEPYLNLFVLSSRLGLAGTVRWRSTEEKLPEVRFHGDAWLDEFSTAEGVETESLLKWKTLRISGLEANLNPPVISALETRLEDVFARLIIEKNRTINLMSALRRGGTNAAAPHLTTNVAPGLIRPKVSIGSVVLSNANIHFVDRSLQPNVNITLERLAGTLSGLSSDGPERAVVDLRGSVDQTALARVTGRVNPWNQRQPTELKIALQEMDLLPGDPYSRKYLGYQLKQGTGSLDTRFHLAEYKLKSENRITLDQLVLGAKVDSPEATKLPVQLAMALLRDRNGRIELVVPVDGSLTDPEFHLGEVFSGAIWKVFNNIATSPFSALSALFGGKGDALNFYEFGPGSTHLLPASFEKLDALANALYERPELKLEIEGGSDSKTDFEALPVGKWRNQEQPKKWQTNVMTNDNEVTRTSLNALVDEKGGGALMRMGMPDLLESADSTPGDLHRLAADRARSIKAYLLQTGRVEEERVSIRQPTRGTPAKGSHVYLGR
ncbi:MAG: DUF748 domain-containing protein [Verrucomicrobiia bacterium]